MWTNNINNKQYIGSSENLRARFLQYFNINHLLRKKCTNIYKALVKHDYSNFSITILEYCEPDKCLIREKHYWDIFKPEYNISQDPTASFSGRKHFDETKQIMSDVHKKIDNPGRYKTGHKHSDETKIIMSDAKKGENYPNYGKTRDDEIKQKISDALKGQPIPSGAGSPSTFFVLTR
jgi:group I intron endonuclease